MNRSRILKIIRNLLFLLALPVCVSAFVWGRKEATRQRLQHIQIRIKNPELSFVTIENINNLLHELQVEEGKTRLVQLPLHTIRQQLTSNPWVKDISLFVNEGGTLFIQLTQRRPVARLQVQDTEEACYLDETGTPMPLSAQYLTSVPVVTVPQIGYNAADLKLDEDLAALATFLHHDSVWNTFITQIQVDEHHGIELIPLAGDEVIVLGDIQNLPLKMQYLKAFYQHHPPTAGWDQYTELDLRFAKQLVARHRNKHEAAGTMAMRNRKELTTASSNNPDPLPVKASGTQAYTTSINPINKK